MIVIPITAITLLVYRIIGNTNKSLWRLVSTPQITGFYNKYINGLISPNQSLQPGPQDNHTISFQNINLTALICYEIAFPHFVEKRAEHADILVVTSDDLWFGYSNAMHQHQQIAAFYAHALHKPTLFVNNNGATAVISANGDIVQTLEANTFGIIETNIPV